MYKFMELFIIPVERYQNRQEGERERNRINSGTVNRSCSTNNKAQVVGVCVSVLRKSSIFLWRFLLIIQ